MTELSKKLIALTAICSLLVASMSATLHQHDHHAGQSCCEHSSHLVGNSDHGNASCCHHDVGHQGSTGCCESSRRQQTLERLSIVQQQSPVDAHHDGPCALCRFLTEHFTQYEVIRHVPLDSVVVYVASLEVIEVESSISMGYFLRGPPRV